MYTLLSLVTSTIGALYRWVGHWRSASYATISSLQNLTPSWWVGQGGWVGSGPGPISICQRPICYGLSWEGGGGCPKEPAPTSISAGWRRLGAGGRLEVGGARLLFALRPPPSGMGGDPGVGGSEPASGEGASPWAIQERSGWLALPPRAPGFAL